MWKLANIIPIGLIYKSNLNGRSSAEFHCNKWQGMQEIGAKLREVQRKLESGRLKMVREPVIVRRNLVKEGDKKT